MNDLNTVMPANKATKVLLSANYKNDTLFTFNIPYNQQVLQFLDDTKTEIVSIPTIIDSDNTSFSFLTSEEDTYEYNTLNHFDNTLFTLFNDSQNNYSTVIDYL